MNGAGRSGYPGTDPRILSASASLQSAPPSNNQDLVYTLTLGAADPNLGKPFAIRIDSFNTFFQNGVPDPGAPINGGTNARFTQGNFDNVRLDYVPEPTSAALVCCGIVALTLRRRR